MRSKAFGLKADCWLDALLPQIWYTDTSRQFLEENFSWFLPTYDSYQFPIQRIDVLRYFLIRHYGGIYLDLDNVSSKSAC